MFLKEYTTSWVTDVVHLCDDHGNNFCKSGNTVHTEFEWFVKYTNGNAEENCKYESDLYCDFSQQPVLKQI